MQEIRGIESLDAEVPRWYTAASLTCHSSRRWDTLTLTLYFKQTTRSSETTPKTKQQTKHNTKLSWQDNSNEILKIRLYKNSHCSKQHAQKYSPPDFIFNFNLILLHAYRRGTFPFLCMTHPHYIGSRSLQFCSVDVLIPSVSCLISSRWWLKCPFELCKAGSKANHC